MLFSREFLEAARARLEPGGVYAQWYHQNETDDEAIALVLRTYAQVFDEIEVWYGVGPDLIVLGFDRPGRTPNIVELQRRVSQPEMEAALERSNIRDLAALAAHELIPAGVIHATSFPGPIHTLIRPRLGYRAARAFFTGNYARTPFTGGRAPAKLGEQRSLIARLLARARTPAQRDRIYASYADELCRHRQPECAATLARWAREYPASAARERIATQRARQRSTFGERVRPGLLREVGKAFEGAEPGGSITAAEGRRLNAVYAYAYHHGAPFSPEALLAKWAQCSGPRRACEIGRREAELMLAGAPTTRTTRLRPVQPDPR
jgi:hypothetical protein